MAVECYLALQVGNGPTHAQQTMFPMVVDDKNPRFDLSDEIWIERLDQQLAKNVQTACEPPHYGIQTIQSDQHLYAFVRRVPTKESTRYEGMSELHATIALSRLVNPTSTGDRYCAKIFDMTVNTSIVQAVQFRGSPDVFLAPNSRDWLSVGDGNDLRQLMPWVSLNKPMHARVHRAFWNHEAAMKSFYLDIRWPLIVSGFEALINTKSEDVTWQFRDRVRQLAAEFAVSITEEELRVAYAMRSKLIHAADFLYGLQKILPATQHSSLYQKLEGLLRTTIKRCLLDKRFGDFFSSAAAVNRRWRLSPNPNRRKKGLCRVLGAICSP